MGKFTIEETEESKQEEMQTAEESKEFNIKVLSPIFGFFIGDIVTPESAFYEQFKIWAGNKSTITVNMNKNAETICEFEK